jgi:predicted nucleic acid-binding protein
MTRFYLDASAWAKRYRTEQGTSWLSGFWRLEPSIVCSELGRIEVMAAIARRHAEAGFPLETTGNAFAAVRTDFAGFHQVPVSAEVLATAESLVLRHRLRGADSIHLTSAMCFRDAIAEPVAMVACDTELLRAAEAEGFAGLDPQLDPPLPVTAP